MPMKKKQKTNSINISILVGAAVLAIAYMAAKSMFGMVASSPVVAEIAAPAPKEEERVERDEYGPLLIDKTALPQDLQDLSSKTFPLYRADFADYWKTGHYSVGKKSVIYSGEPFSNVGSSMYLQLSRDTIGNAENLQTDLDFALPANKLYTVEFYTKLLKDTDYNAWIRLHTNVTDKGYYEISFHPQTQAYELVEVTEGIRKVLRQGTSTMIRKDSSYNFVKVIRNPTVGILKVYVNGNTKALYQVTNKDHVGGYNRLILTSYGTNAHAMFTKFLVY